MSAGSSGDRDNAMVGLYPSEVARTVGALMAPFIMLFGLYVVAHGHDAPGGGFAGGVLLAVGPILLRLTFDLETTERVFPAARILAIALLGFLAFVLLGLVPLAVGGEFLDYAAVPVADLAASRLRYLGILLVEVAVAFAVFGTIVAIFDAVVGDRPFGDRS